MENELVRIIGNVYETKDYGMFKLIKGNRDVNESDVVKLAESISIKYNICPIIVTSDFYVIDGQHRVLVCKRLDLPVRYVIDPNAVLEDVLRLNSYSKKWTAQDYLLSYKKQGIKPYIDIYKFMIEYDIPIKLALSALGKDSGKGFNDFKYGNLCTKNLDEAKWLVGKFFTIRGHNKKLKARFLNVLKQVIKNEDFNIDLFIRKLKLQPTRLVSCATAEQYRGLIEDIYNYRNRHKVSLRF